MKKCAFVPRNIMKSFPFFHPYLPKIGLLIRLVCQNTIGDSSHSRPYQSRDKFIGGLHQTLRQ